METNKTDKLLKLFFAEQKQVLPDNGFTQLVMRKLPEIQDHTWIVWIFGCIGMTLSFAMGIHVGWLESFIMYVQHIQLLYLLAIIFCFPLICSLAMYMSQHNHFRMI